MIWDAKALRAGLKVLAKLTPGKDVVSLSVRDGVFKLSNPSVGIEFETDCSTCTSFDAIVSPKFLAAALHPNAHRPEIGVTDHTVFVRSTDVHDAIITRRDPPKVV